MTCKKWRADNRIDSFQLQSLWVAAGLMEAWACSNMASASAGSLFITFAPTY
jgi:hypothetical protein